MSRFTFVTIIVVLVMVAAHAQQQTNPQPGWIADRNGCRVWDWNPQPNESITWDGRCESGVATGKGTVHWFKDEIPNGTFEGEYIDGRLNGHGTAVYAIEGMYEGEWKDYKRDGHGVMVYANGDRYDGEWKDGKRNGHGVLVKHLDGSRYDGDWKDGNFMSPNGLVYEPIVVVYKDGGRYEGQFRDGRRNGHGVYVYPNGSRYEGDWKDGNRTGHGVMVWSNGNSFEGEWKDNQAHGQGTFRDSVDGFVASGTWVNGCFQALASVGGGAPWRHAGVGTDWTKCPY